MNFCLFLCALFVQGKIGLNHYKKFLEQERLKNVTLLSDTTFGYWATLNLVAEHLNAPSIIKNLITTTVENYRNSFQNEEIVRAVDMEQEELNIFTAKFIWFVEYHEKKLPRVCIIISAVDLHTNKFDFGKVFDVAATMLSNDYLRYNFQTKMHEERNKFCNFVSKNQDAKKIPKMFTHKEVFKINLYIINVYLGIYFQQYALFSKDESFKDWKNLYDEYLAKFVRDYGEIEYSNTDFENIYTWFRYYYGDIVKKDCENLIYLESNDFFKLEIMAKNILKTEIVDYARMPIFECSSLLNYAKYLSKSQVSDLESNTDFDEALSVMLSLQCGRECGKFSEEMKEKIHHLVAEKCLTEDIRFFQQIFSTTLQINHDESMDLNYPDYIPL